MDLKMEGAAARRSREERPSSTSARPPSTTKRNTPERSALLPVAILIDELKHDDMTVRLNSVRKLDEIAIALGPQRTRDELIPYLSGNGHVKRNVQRRS
jgi:hypothetical protein